MKFLRQLLVRVGLDAECLADGKHLEQEGKLSTIPLSDLSRHQRLVILDHVEECALGLEILGREGGMGAHP